LTKNARNVEENFISALGFKVDESESRVQVGEDERTVGIEKFRLDFVAEQQWACEVKFEEFSFFLKLRLLSSADTFEFHQHRTATVAVPANQCLVYRQGA
jgi:hypothetical protein